MRFFRRSVWLSKQLFWLKFFLILLITYQNNIFMYVNREKRNLSPFNPLLCANRTRQLSNRRYKGYPRFWSYSDVSTLSGFLWSRQNKVLFGKPPHIRSWPLGIRTCANSTTPPLIGGVVELSDDNHEIPAAIITSANVTLGTRANGTSSWEGEAEAIEFASVPKGMSLWVGDGFSNSIHSFMPIRWLIT